MTAYITDLIIVMHTIKHIVHTLEKIAPLSYAQTWDNVGLLVGDPKASVSSILICVTLTEDVLQEACEKNVNLIISHHPFPFHPLRSITEQHTSGRMLRRLIQRNISLYSAHTAYDDAPLGINEQILSHNTTASQMLPLISQDNDQSKKNAAKRAQLKSPQPLSEIITRTKAYFSCSSLPLRIVHPLQQVKPHKNTTIQHPAAACGVGSGFVDAVIAQRCDLFITGELRYHECLQLRSAGCTTILVGHFHSELPGMNTLSRKIQNTLPNTHIIHSQSDMCPIEVL